MSDKSTPEIEISNLIQNTREIGTFDWLEDVIDKTSLLAKTGGDFPNEEKRAVATNRVRRAVFEYYIRGSERKLCGIVHRGQGTVTNPSVAMVFTAQQFDDLLKLLSIPEIRADKFGSCQTCIHGPIETPQTGSFRNPVCRTCNVGNAMHLTPEEFAELKEQTDDVIDPVSFCINTQARYYEFLEQLPLPESESSHTNWLREKRKIESEK